MRIRWLPPYRKCSGLLLFGLFLLGCAHTVVVEVPPKIDLQPYETIGIVEFTSNTTGNLNRVATEKFMGFVQNAQPRVRFLELGPEHELVRKLERDSLDAEAMRAIETRYGVGSVFTGRVEISPVSPRVSLGADLSSVSASAAVTISMVSKHRETSSGATIWSGSRQGTWTVAGIRSDSRDFSFRVDGSDEKYGRHIEDLAFAMTDPFRPHYVRRKVPR